MNWWPESRSICFSVMRVKRSASFANSRQFSLDGLTVLTLVKPMNFDQRAYQTCCPWDVEAAPDFRPR
jgi:hypothetical protein